MGWFPEGRVPRRRKVVLAACRAGRAVPLRREVPRGEIAISKLEITINSKFLTVLLFQKVRKS